MGKWVSWFDKTPLPHAHASSAYSGSFSSWLMSHEGMEEEYREFLKFNGAEENYEEEEDQN